MSKNDNDRKRKTRKLMYRELSQLRERIEIARKYFRQEWHMELAPEVIRYELSHYGVDIRCRSFDEELNDISDFTLDFYRVYRARKNGTISRRQIAFTAIDVDDYDDKRSGHKILPGFKLYMEDVEAIRILYSIMPHNEDIYMKKCQYNPVKSCISMLFAKRSDENFNATENSYDVEIIGKSDETDMEKEKEA